MSAPFSVSQALKHVFFEPRLPQRLLWVRPRAITAIIAAPPQVRHKRTKAAPTQRVVRSKWNDEIEATYIQLIDPESKKPLEPDTRWNVLRSFDPKVERLVQLQEATEPYKGQPLAICHIVNIKEDQLRERAREKAAAEQRRASAIVNSVKTLEFNWNIDRRDLEHRLNRGKAFLEEGRKVEVVLARKKKANRATREQCIELVEHIKETLHSIDGVRSEPMQGEYEKVAQLKFKNTYSKPKATITTMTTSPGEPLKSNNIADATAASASP